MMLRKTSSWPSLLGMEPTASMRPQHDAAENADQDVGVWSDERASMRPQHDAAENGRLSGSRRALTTSFNEAAA